MKLLYAHFVKYVLTLLLFFLFIVPVSAVASVIILLIVPISTFIGTVNQMTTSLMDTLDKEISKMIVINEIKKVKDKYIRKCLNMDIELIEWLLILL